MDKTEAELTLRQALSAALGRPDLDIVDSGPEGRRIRLSGLGIDSLVIMELGITLESDFGVEINPGAFSLHPETTYEELLEFFTITVAP